MITQRHGRRGRSGRSDRSDRSDRSEKTTTPHRGAPIRRRPKHTRSWCRALGILLWTAALTIGLLIVAVTALATFGIIMVLGPLVALTLIYIRWIGAAPTTWAFAINAALVTLLALK